MPNAPTFLQVPEQAGGTDWLPYSSIDRMFALCEARLAKPGPPANRFGDGKEGEVDGGASGGWRERQAGLAAAFGVAQQRLVEYFKVRGLFPIFYFSLFVFVLSHYFRFFLSLLCCFLSTVHVFLAACFLCVCFVCVFVCAFYSKVMTIFSFARSDPPI